MPQKLVAWCCSNGFRGTDGCMDAEKVAKARKAGRSWLASGLNCSELVDEVGIAKLVSAGSGKTQEITQKAVELALGGEPNAVVTEFVTSANNSKEQLSRELKLAQDELSIRTEAFKTYTGLRRAELNPEYKQLANRKRRAQDAVDRLVKNLAQATDGAAAIGRLSRNIKSIEQDDKTAKQNAELTAKLAELENAPKPEPEVIVKQVVDTTEADNLRQQYEELLNANAKLRAQITDRDERLEQSLEMSRKAHKKLEHAQGAAREWENYSTARRRGLIKANISHFWEASAMLGYCRKYPETVGGMGEAFNATVEQLEDLAIDAMIAWLPFLPSEKLTTLRVALTERGDIPPAETLDSRELETIDV